MTPETVGPLSRPVDVMNLPPRGLEVHVEAAEEERIALAQDFGLPGIQRLAGDFKLTSSAKGIHIMGVVKASITQICVVTLDPFASDVREDVEVDFAAGATPHQGEDPPDEIVGGAVDVGALTAEFLALGLDPHPRKPGVDFSFEAAEDPPPSPFAALEKLKRDE